MVKTKNRVFEVFQVLFLKWNLLSFECIHTYIHEDWMDMAANLAVTWYDMNDRTAIGLDANPSWNAIKISSATTH
jgi:hypothetical protein